MEFSKTVSNDTIGRNVFFLSCALGSRLAHFQDVLVIADFHELFRSDGMKTQTWTFHTAPSTSG